ncbi:hypothetical protein VE03_01442 [Pseudogymnoascus sp. 23342-1-I1]|nr:hypothetical protein VE03_01442 [Pseudogymnoascus sp. 23342-1-I1]
MASLLTKLLAPILALRPHKKIAILGLHEADGIALLKNLCSTTWDKLHEKGYVRVPTGTKRTLRCDYSFVFVDVQGANKFRQWLEEQFEDADGFIWIVGSADTDYLVEAREEMRMARVGRGSGRRERQGIERAGGVRPGAPWMVLVDFKGDPLVWHPRSCCS